MEGNGSLKTTVVALKKTETERPYKSFTATILLFRQKAIGFSKCVFYNLS